MVAQTTTRNCATAVDAVIQATAFGKKVQIGIEACATSAALTRNLRRLGYAVSAFDCAQLKSFASIRRSKTDANDARSIADAARLGRNVLVEVHLKSPSCMALRAILAARHNLVKQRKGTEHLIRSYFHLYGTSIGTRITAAHRLRPHVLNRLDEIRAETGEDLSPLIMPLLEMAECQRELSERWEQSLKKFATEDKTCTRFLAVPGVGPITAVSFYSAIEDPSRFSRSSDVGAYFGLTPKIHISGGAQRKGQITKAGNRMTRFHIVTAANALLNATKTQTALRDWGLEKVAAIGRRKARVAVARKLTTILFSMWRDGTPYQPFPQAPEAQSSGSAAGRRRVEISINDVGHPCDPEDPMVRFDAPSYTGLTDNQRVRQEKVANQISSVYALAITGKTVAQMANDLCLSKAIVERRLAILRQSNAIADRRSREHIALRRSQDPSA
ncbi:transposase [Novosphingobium sp. PhB165]|nr:transposase [Novosphingobium sp. PhB165]